MASRAAFTLSPCAPRTSTLAPDDFLNWCYRNLFLCSLPFLWILVQTEKIIPLAISFLLRTHSTPHAYVTAHTHSRVMPSATVSPSYMSTPCCPSQRAPLCWPSVRVDAVHPWNTPSQLNSITNTSEPTGWLQTGARRNLRSTVN